MLGKQGDNFFASALLTVLLWSLSKGGGSLYLIILQ